MNPQLDLLINLLLAAIFAALKAQGLSEEEAKEKLYAKVTQVESLPPLPMDLPE